MKIGLLVGHFGKGTGASYTDPGGTVRDEWQYAWMDAHTVGKMLEARGHVVTTAWLDRDTPRDKAIGSILSDRGGLSAMNIAIRAQWAIEAGCECVLELHYNSAEDTSAKGHEVLIDDDEPAGSKSERLATLVNDHLSLALPLHPNRGIKRMRLRVMELLRRAGIPCCLVEPAFLFEDILADRRLFTGQYYRALVEALEAFGK